jgi:hypothetical protein
MKSKRLNLLFCLCSITLIIASCSSPVEKAEDARTKAKSAFETEIVKAQASLNDLNAEINTLLDSMPAMAVTDTFVDLPDHLWFIPLMRDNSVPQRKPDPQFNAMYISTTAKGGALPKGMKKDYFESDSYLDLQELAKGSPARKYGESPDANGVESISTYARSLMVANQLQKMRYIVVVHYLSFDAGSLDYYAQTLVPATMEARVMVYDRTTKKVCGVKQVSVEGTQEFSRKYNTQTTSEVQNESQVRDEFENLNKVSIVSSVLRSIVPGAQMGTMR